VPSGVADRSARPETPPYGAGSERATEQPGPATTAEVHRRAAEPETAGAVARDLPAPPGGTPRPAAGDSSPADAAPAATTADVRPELSTPAAPPSRQRAAVVARVTTADVRPAAADSSPGRGSEPRAVHPFARAAEVRRPAARATERAQVVARAVDSEPAPPETSGAPGIGQASLSARRASARVVAAGPPASVSDAPPAMTDDEGGTAAPAASSASEAAGSSVVLARERDVPAPGSAVTHDSTQAPRSEPTRSAEARRAAARPEAAEPMVVAPAARPRRPRGEPDAGGHVVRTRAVDSPAPGRAEPEPTPLLPDRSRDAGAPAGEAREAVATRLAAEAGGPAHGPAEVGKATPALHQRFVESTPSPLGRQSTPALHQRFVESTPSPLGRQSTPAPHQRFVESTPSPVGRQSTPAPPRPVVESTQLEVRPQATPAPHQELAEPTPPAGGAATPAPPDRLHRDPGPARPLDRRVVHAPVAAGASASPPAADGLLRPAYGAERSPGDAPIGGEHRPLSTRAARPPAPVQRDHEHAAAAAEAASTPAAGQTAGHPPTAVRRPGLDLHAVLAAPRVSSSPASYAPVRRASEPVAGPRVRAARTAAVVDAVPVRRPGLDVARAFAGPRPEPVGAVSRARAEAVSESPAADRPQVLTPLRLAAAPAHVTGSAPAAEPSAPPALVSLPSPPVSPPSVQRVTSWDDSEGGARARLAEAPDDELQELADRIYGHIRARFRTELLIDRERAGLLADRY
jgi:hypothetical protein